MFRDEKNGVLFIRNFPIAGLPFFGGLHHEDYGILGSIFGSPLP